MIGGSWPVLLSSAELPRHRPPGPAERRLPSSPNLPTNRQHAARGNAPTAPPNGRAGHLLELQVTCSMWRGGYLSQGLAGLADCRRASITAAAALSVRVLDLVARPGRRPRVTVGLPIANAAKPWPPRNKRGERDRADGAPSGALPAVRYPSPATIRRHASGRRYPHLRQSAAGEWWPAAVCSKSGRWPIARGRDGTPIHRNKRPRGHEGRR